MLARHYFQYLLGLDTVLLIVLVLVLHLEEDIETREKGLTYRIVLSDSVVNKRASSGREPFNQIVYPKAIVCG